MSKMTRKGETIISGIFVLTAAGIVVKMIGLFFKIPLSRLLGDEGMGYFNAAYTIYSWLYVISTAGLPVAVSVLVSRVSEKRGEAERVFRVALRTLALTGCLLSVLTVVFAVPLSVLIGSRESSLAIAFVAPTLFFVSVTGGFRGYFQGKKQMIPTAVSQVIEALCKLVLGILCGGYAVRRGMPLPTVAAYSILGVTAGTVLGSLYLFAVKASERRRGEAELTQGNSAFESGTLRSLLKIALPITVSSAVMSFSNLIDLGMIMNRLSHAGYSVREATALFGNYTTLVVPMTHLPSILITPIASSIVPHISSAGKRGAPHAVKNIIETSLRYSALLTLPCIALFVFFGKEILSLLFEEGSASIAAMSLAALSPAPFFLGLITVTNAALQACGQANKTVRSMLVGAAAKVLICYLLIGNPRFGIYGAAIGTVGGYAISAVINIRSLRLAVGGGISPARFLARAFAANALFTLSLFLLSRISGMFLHTKLMTVLLMAASALLYLLFVFLLRAVKEEDIRFLGFGKNTVFPFARKIR